MDLITPDVAGGVIIGAFGLLGILVQRGRRETVERFDRLARQISDLVSTVKHIDERQDRADVERAVIKNEVETIKDRHHLMDMVRRDPGRHKRGRGIWLPLAALIQALALPIRWW